MIQIEDCKTCRFCLSEEPNISNAQLYCTRFPMWERIPRNPPEPHWCGEWKPLWDRLCRRRHLRHPARPASKTGVVPAASAVYDYCYRVPKHEGDHTDAVGTWWTDAECVKD